MQDRYLFRGKPLNGSDWVYGGLHYEDTDAEIIEDMSTYSDGFMQAFGECVRPETIGQCTGIKDKHGKLIFEGDIIEVMLPETSLHKALCMGRGEVFYENGSYKYQKQGEHIANTPRLDDHADNVTFEIIGNVHDNAEKEKTNE